MARVNKQLLRHKILVILDDRGNFSGRKVNLCFLYFKPTPCIDYLNDFMDKHEHNNGATNSTTTTAEYGWENRLDITMDDIIIQGSNTTRVSRKQVRDFVLFYFILSYNRKKS